MSSALSTWVFGYGSLIYKVDFSYLERRTAHIVGWERRFWQGSHDHRGTPEAPGRVVTLVPSPGAICQGVAYRVVHDVFDHLDHREKNGYERVDMEIRFDDEGAIHCAPGVTYYADESNPAFLGDAPLADLADHIAGAEGPSGRNSDYLLDLATALRELGEQDAHVFSLEVEVLRVLGSGASRPEVSPSLPS